MTKSRKHLVWRFAAATAAMCSVFVNPVLSIVNATNIDDEEKANMPSDSFCEDDFEMDAIEKQQHDSNEEEEFVYDYKVFLFDHIQEVPWSDKEVDWEDYFTYFSLADTYDLLGCDEYTHHRSENHKFSVIDQDAWMLLRDKYNAVVWAKYESSIPFPASDKNGFLVPIQVKEVNRRHEDGEVETQMEVYVTQSVKAGDLVWIPQQQAKFHKVLDFQRFIVSIPLELACVVMDWVYAPYDDLLCLDLDESSIFSSSFNDEDVDEDDMGNYFNAGCLPNSEWMPGGCDLNMFALRDINAGERLLIDFGDYSIPRTWEWHYDFYNVAKRSIKYEHDSLISTFIETGDEPWDNEDITWEDFFEMEHGGLEHLLNCWNQYETEQQIPDESSWRGLQEAYRSIPGYEDAFLFPPSTNGFQVLIEVKQAEGKGRGVFVTEAVKRGELVVLPHNTAKFRKGSDYRRFVASVPLQLVCDVLQWSYVAFFDDLGDIITPYVATDLDEACVMNEGIRDDNSDTNVGCILEAEWVPGGCDNLFALRDIEAGEELLCTYADFAVTDGWAWLKL